MIAVFGPVELDVRVAQVSAEKDTYGVVVE